GDHGLPIRGPASRSADRSTGPTGMPGCHRSPTGCLAAFAQTEGYVPTRCRIGHASDTGGHAAPESRAMNETAVTRVDPHQNRTVTFLFTDIEGSTRLWAEQREAMAVALEAHDAILRAAVERSGG